MTMSARLKLRLTQEISRRLADRSLRVVRPRPTSLVSLAGNDYLGAGSDSALREAFFLSNAGRLALSSGSSPLLYGESEGHERLKATLERLFGRKALLFPSGWHLNTGLVDALGALFRDRVLFLADRLVHASTIDGLLAAKRHGASFRRYPHNDTAALARLLAEHAGAYEVVVVLTESLFSMDGDRADLRALAELKAQYPNVLLAVDEAHGLGVLGESGLGLIEETNTADAVDFRILTFGKAAASSGAALLADDQWLTLLPSLARPLIFSTAESPLQAAWTAFVLEHFASWSDRRARLADLARRVHDVLDEPRGNPGVLSPILPWCLGDNERTLTAARRLEDAGFLVSAVRPPTVPAGTSRIRISLSSALSETDVERFIAALRTVKEEITS